MMNERIFLSPPSMSGKEIELIKEVFESNYIAPLGPMVDRFEQSMCDYTGYAYSVALSSGTAAVHLALKALGVGENDAVWASSLTFIGSVSPVLFCGARLVFVDSSLEDWNIDCHLLEENLKRASVSGSLPKVILVTDLYGQPCDYDHLNKLCSEYGVYLVSDSAESLGSSYKNKKANAELSAYSFNGNKIITTSGGGVLSSNNKKFIDHAKYLSQQAREPFPYYHHIEVGNNYRMSNVLAAIGVGQLEILNQRVFEKKKLFEYYKKELSIDSVSFLPILEDRNPNYWLSVMRIDPYTGVTPEDVRLRLEEHNIESRPVWKPMHLQPVFAGYDVVGGKVSEEIFSTGLCLPSSTQMSDDQRSKVVSIIKDAFSR